MARRIMAAGRIPATLQFLINQMSNWQRNQWSRAGYPTDPIRVQFFLGLLKYDRAH
jgi:hypothetical protein